MGRIDLDRPCVLAEHRIGGLPRHDGSTYDAQGLLCQWVQLRPANEPVKISDGHRGTMQQSPLLQRLQAQLHEKYPG